MSTIVALSTPRGRGALAVIRLSGPLAINIATQMASLGEIEPRKAKLVRITRGDQIVDEVILTCFLAPHSLTGEDVVEISCHGSPAVVREIVDRVLELGGVLAGPGEFTLRALTNGKINLAQAEAIRDLISAQTDAAVKQAARQMNGELSNTLQPFKEKLVEVIVLLESALEFVEDDLPAPRLSEIEETLASVIAGVDKLSASFNAGRLLQDGVRVTIAGRERDTGSRHVGAFLGDHTKTGIHTMLNTGTVTGAFSNLFGAGFHPKEVPSFVWGGEGRWQEHELAKAMDVAAIVSARREVKYTDADRRLAARLYEATARHRRGWLSQF